MSPDVISVLAYSGFVAAVAVVGGLLPLARKWGQDSLHLLFGFSAGVLSAAAFLDLIPEAFSEEAAGATAGYYVLAGLLFLFLVERYAVAHPCAPLHREPHPIGFLALIGLSLHNLTDGLALGASALVPGVGQAVFLAVLIHNGPTGASLTGLLMIQGHSRPAIVLRSIFCFLMIPLGAVISFSVIRAFPGSVLGAALAFSAGTFIYIALSDILPEIHRHTEKKSYAVFGLLAGLLIMWLAQLLQVE